MKTTDFRGSKSRQFSHLGQRSVLPCSGCQFLDTFLTLFREFRANPVFHPFWPFWTHFGVIGLEGGPDSRDMTGPNGSKWENS